MIAALSNPIIVSGAIAGVVSLVTAYFGYQRGRKVDEIADQSRVDEREGKGVDQVIGGLNDLVSRLQEDNKVLRGNVRALDEKLSIAIREIEGLRAEIRELKDRIPPVRKSSK